MRGLPFPLAHIEVIVAGRAAPVDAVRRLAGDEAAVLPEVLARAGAAAAVQTVDHGGGDAARLEDEPRHGGGERAGLAGRSPRRLALVLRPCRLRHRSPDARLEPADDRLDGLAVRARREGER